MGFTIEDALVQTKEQYKLQLLAGQQGCANAISWVHLIEDTTIIKQLWGKELVVTTGLGFQNPESLKELVQCLVKYHSVGLIINTGKYIFDIPKDIIDYCNEQDLPLLTTPWEVHLADVIKDLSMRCLYSEKSDQEISQYFKNAFTDIKTIEEARLGLMGSFDVDGTFQVLLIGIDESDQFDEIEKRRLSFQLQLYFEKIECLYSSFWYSDYFVLVVNNLNQNDFQNIVDKMYKRAKKRMANRHIHVGIGTCVQSFRNVVQSYKHALAAVELSVQFKKDIVYFEQMGIYQILFSIDDKQILMDMYQKLLGVLIDYDQKHNGELVKTLYYYLKYESSPQTIAENMYTHRNTVYYRIDKIKQLLNNDLDSLEKRFTYMMAFYIQRMFE